MFIYCYIPRPFFQQLDANFPSYSLHERTPISHLMFFCLQKSNLRRQKLNSNRAKLSPWYRQVMFGMWHCRRNEMGSGNAISDLIVFVWCNYRNISLAASPNRYLFFSFLFSQISGRPFPSLRTCLSLKLHDSIFFPAGNMPYFNITLLFWLAPRCVLFVSFSASHIHLEGIRWVAERLAGWLSSVVIFLCWGFCMYYTKLPHAL